ncbi:threonine dehydratase [Acuticoccus kandeliae]|uniref:threonine dehydratase n=1 Tax=Acuticoccus kandeliae TaxID=2073160 RepID=UPI000D3E1E56|nr:threonine dehydratase [Acuticoccus kandeliae]
MDLETIEDAARIVYRHMPPTPQYRWAQLATATGANVWVKHENHTPIGAFKIRGSLTFMDWLRRTHPEVPGIVTATRGNHGQGQALAATANGLKARVYCPVGNSVEKNAAMRAFGAELIEVGRDFDESRVLAHEDAAARGYYFVPPFHPALVAGVATYALEFFRGADPLDTVYVPIGCGSGICGLIHVRDALGLATEIVGVVSERADCVPRSIAAGHPVETPTAETFADGIATRVPFPEALAVYGPGAARIVTVSDDEVAEAMRLLYRVTHNVAEGTGAASLAALMKERAAMAGRTVGVILSGGNVDAGVFAEVLSGRTPAVAKAAPMNA